ncbi:hypothetical protein ACU18_12800, partial [Arthrobacter sp. ZBG10]|uniref:hypothetical protein n=1 Tax=Arthrobacter sp. ZBG10 TaxID=1676590 RepID=UPI0006A52EE2
PNNTPHNPTRSNAKRQKPQHQNGNTRNHNTKDTKQQNSTPKTLRHLNTTSPTGARRSSRNYQTPRHIS